MRSLRAKRGLARRMALAGAMAVGALLLGAPNGAAHGESMLISVEEARAAERSIPSGGDFTAPHGTHGGGAGLAEGGAFRVFATSGVEGGEVASGGQFSVRPGSVHRGVTVRMDGWLIY